MPVPYRIHTQISKKEIIRTAEARCSGDIKYIVQIQRGENHRRSGVCGSCTYVREHTAEDKCIELYGIPEREEHADDL